MRFLLGFFLVALAFGAPTRSVDDQCTEAGDAMWCHATYGLGTNFCGEEEEFQLVDGLCCCA